MKATTFFLALLCFGIKVSAQDYKFGKVSKEELQEKFNPLDSSASATYIHKYRRTYIQYRQEEGFSMVTEIYERLKIYNTEGFDYATKTINLHVSGSDEENAAGIKGNTYNLVNGKVEETKLDKEHIFKTETSKYLNQVKLTMPNLKAGSVIEWKYTVKSPFYWNVDDFVFQHDIPVKDIYALFETPEYFNFKVNSLGFLPLNPKEEKRRGVIRFTDKERTVGGTTFNNSELDYVINTTTFNLNNVVALRDEPYVNNINNYKSGVKYELSYTKFPQAPLKYYTTTWEDVVKTIYESNSFGDEIKKTGYFEDDLKPLIANVSNPLERAAIIYNLVRSQVKWNGYFGKYTDDGVKKAYQTKRGNVAEINLMLTSMLRYAGLNANPVLISTRENGVPLFPTIDGYNYVISAIEAEEGTILLDATSEFSTPNILPVRVLNWVGRIVRDDKSSSTINLYPKQKSTNAFFLMANLSDNGTLEGQFRSTKTSHAAMEYRKDYLGMDKDFYLENLENKFGGIQIEEFAVENDVDLLKPVSESYKFTLESQADIINNKIYFSPLFFLRTKEHPFKLEQREFPIDFSYPSSNKYMININLPEGYQLESLPKELALALPDNLGSFKYNIVGNGSKIQVVINTEINQAIVSPVYYNALKAYFSQLIEKESEQIVLTKI